VDDDYLDHRGAYVRQWDITRIISKTELLDYMFGHGFFCVWGGGNVGGGSANGN